MRFVLIAILVLGLLFGCAGPQAPVQTVPSNQGQQNNSVNNTLQVPPSNTVNTQVPAAGYPSNISNCVRMSVDEVAGQIPKNLLALNSEGDDVQTAVLGLNKPFTLIRYRYDMDSTGEGAMFSYVVKGCTQNDLDLLRKKLTELSSAYLDPSVLKLSFSGYEVESIRMRDSNFGIIVYWLSNGNLIVTQGSNNGFLQGTWSLPELSYNSRDCLGQITNVLVANHPPDKKSTALEQAHVQDPTSCNDSDGGDNRLQKGTVKEGVYSETDTCVGYNTLVEFECLIQSTSRPAFQRQVVDCNAGMICYDGACIKAASSTCNDTDGGLNYFVKGKAEFNNPGVDSGYMTDACIDANRLREYYCKDGTAQYVSYTCANGCQDGACING